jgi:hypothetical protein
MLGYSDSELAALGGYDLVHYDDLSYISSAHQEREFTNRKPCNVFSLHQTFILSSSSSQDRRFGNDCLSISEERPRVAVAADKLKISL